MTRPDYLFFSIVGPEGRDINWYGSTVRQVGVCSYIRRPFGRYHRVGTAYLDGAGMVFPPKKMWLREFKRFTECTPGAFLEYPDGDSTVILAYNQPFGPKKF